MNALDIRDVSYVVDRPLLDAISLELRPGELTAISGPSGSGKTTLLSIAGGLLEPSSGVTSYDGEPMWQGTGDPREHVAFVLQVYGLIPILSARENVSVALRARGLAPAEADRRAEEALARFHIADLGDRQVEELSGGQMQRVACARGFVVGARILLADEPTSELDSDNRGLVLGELRQEAQLGAIVVVATHDPAVVEACDRHYVLDEGRLVDHVAEVDLSRWAREVPPTAPTLGEPVGPGEPLGPVEPHPPATPAPTMPAPPPAAPPTPETVEATRRTRRGRGEPDRLDEDAAFRRPPNDRR